MNRQLVALDCRRKSGTVMKRLACVMAVAAWLGSAHSASALTLGFAPSRTFATTSGSSYQVDVVLSGLPLGGIVAAFDLTVLFDPTVLALGSGPSVIFGNALGNTEAHLPVKNVTNIYTEVLTKFTTPKSGAVEFRSTSLMKDAPLTVYQAPFDSSITLATLYFSGVSTSTASLAFEWAARNDIKGAGNTVIYSGANEPAPVPEPGTMFLLVAGLASLLLVLRPQLFFFDGNHPRGG